MKTREPRRKVLVGARIRHGLKWDDIRILDISSRGLCLHGRNAPPRGTYVELRRGRQQIVARVVWTAEEKFGVVAQDPIAVEAVISDPDHVLPTPAAPVGDRRAIVRNAQGHERSKMLARAFQSGFFMIAGGCAALALAMTVAEAFTRPMKAISIALASSAQ